MAINNTLVGTSATAVFTASGNQATTAIFFMNENGGTRTLDVHLVPSGGSAGVTNKILKAISVTAGNTYVINTEKIVLANGDSIQAIASHVDSIHATVSSVAI